MADTVMTLENPVMHKVGPVGERQPQNPVSEECLPDGLQIVSADNHWEITEDIFHDHLPDALKPLAPRVWFDRYWRLAHRGNADGTFGQGENVDAIMTRGLIQRGWEHDFRAGQLRGEGIQKEIVFPQSMMAFAAHSNLELREAMLSIYNEYIAEQSANNPGFYGVGICANWWDPSKARQAVHKIARLGLKTFMIPHSLKGPDGKARSFAAPEMDKFWTAVEEVGLPLNFHVGENANYEGRGSAAATIMTAFAPFRRPISELIFGGVFDRHPALKVVFSEGGLNWIAPTLQDAEMIYDSYGDLLDPIEHRPSYYWHKHCYATFQNDPLGLAQLNLIGTDRVMWAADYPHSEGTFGYTRESLRAVVDATSDADARLVLGGTARKLYCLD